MKNTIKVLGIISVVLVIAMAAGCASMRLISLEQDTVDGPKQVGQGQDIDPKTITVWGNYEDGSRRLVSVSASNIIFNKNATGVQTVKVRMSNYEVTFQTQVMPLLSLTLVSPPAKLEYFKGEALDLSGLRVNGAWNGLPAGEVKVDASNITGFNTNNAGTQRLTLTLNGKSVNFNVTVSQLDIAARDLNGTWGYTTTTGEGVTRTEEITFSNGNYEGTMDVTAGDMNTKVLTKGTYTTSGNSITMKQTHNWQNNAWVSVSVSQPNTYTYSISGNTLTLTHEVGTSFEFARK